MQNNRIDCKYPPPSVCSRLWLVVSLKKAIPHRLKPQAKCSLTARLNSCPLKRTQTALARRALLSALFKHSASHAQLDCSNRRLDAPAEKRVSVESGWGGHWDALCCFFCRRRSCRLCK